MCSRTLHRTQEREMGPQFAGSDPSFFFFFFFFFFYRWRIHLLLSKYMEVFLGRLVFGRSAVGLRPTLYEKFE